MVFSVLRFHKSVAFAAGGEVQPMLEKFEDKPQEIYVYIKAVKLWIRKWEGRPIVGGQYLFKRKNPCSTKSVTLCVNVRYFYVLCDIYI